MMAIKISTLVGTGKDRWVWRFPKPLFPEKHHNFDNFFHCSYLFYGGADFSPFPMYFS